MSDGHETRWSLIHSAAAGSSSAREEFARAYEPVIRAYLTSRWRSPARCGEIGDAIQEVFLACFQEHGALTRADPGRGDFRAYLYGVVRNVARRLDERRARHERRPGRQLELDQVAADDPTLSRIFDRAWAQALLREAVRHHAEQARSMDEAAERRVELLRLRFQEGLPIREIAARWAVDATHLHREYARGRAEFAAALRSVVKKHQGGTSAAVDAECARLAEFFRLA